MGRRRRRGDWRRIGDAVLTRIRIARTRAILACTVWFTVGGCARSLPTVPADRRLLDLGGHAAQDGLPQKFDVVVWNIEKARRRNWKTDFARVIEGAEIVLLQEVGTEASMDGIFATRHGLHWQLGASFHRWGPDAAPTGVATGASARSRTSVVVHSPTREPLTQTPKAALISIHALSTGPHDLLIVNLHGINFRPAPHLKAQLDPFGPAISRHQGPVIFAGDFNTHHRARMEVVETFAETHGLTAAFPNSVPHATRRRVARDGRTRHICWPLDHIYVRGLTVEYARVLPEIDGSDHKPLQIGVSVVR